MGTKTVNHKSDGGGGGIPQAIFKSSCSKKPLIDMFFVTLVNICCKIFMTSKMKNTFNNTGFSVLGDNTLCNV